MANEEKSVWIPSQYVELLGFIVDLKAGTFHVPPHRVDALKQLLKTLLLLRISVYLQELCLA